MSGIEELYKGLKLMSWFAGKTMNTKSDLPILYDGVGKL